MGVCMQPTCTCICTYVQPRDGSFVLHTLYIAVNVIIHVLYICMMPNKVLYMYCVYIHCSCTVQSPISSALMSFRRSMFIFLASILLSISRVRWRPICRRGCWKAHCWRSTQRQRVRRREASTGHPRRRTISKRPRMIRPAF